MRGDRGTRNGDDGVLRGEVGVLMGVVVKDGEGWVVELVAGVGGCGVGGAAPLD